MLFSFFLLVEIVNVIVVDVIIIIIILGFPFPPSHNVSFLPVFLFLLQSFGTRKSVVLSHQ